MITNDVQYKATLGAMEHVRSSIASLKREMRPKSVQWFAIMAGGPLDDLARLQAEVDEYLGVSTAEEAQAEVWMHIEGRNITWPQAATSVLTQFLEDLRTGVQQITEFLSHGGQLSSRPTNEVRSACDFQVMGLKPGSLRVGVRLPAVAVVGSDVPERDVHAVRALEDFLKMARLINQPGDDVDQSFTEVTYRRVVLNAVKSLAPRPRGSVESVGFSGWRIGAAGDIVLTRESRINIDSAIKRTSSTPAIEVTGQIREIDLDTPGFTLRHPKKPDCKCTLPDELLETAKTALDRWVTVTGTQTRRSARQDGPITIEVVTIDVLEDAPEDIHPRQEPS